MPSNLQEILNELDFLKEEAKLELARNEALSSSKSHYGALLKDNPTEKELRESQKALDKRIKDNKKKLSIVNEAKALKELMGEKIRELTKGKGVSRVVNLANSLRTRRIDRVNTKSTGEKYRDALEGDIAREKKKLLDSSDTVKTLQQALDLKKGKKLPDISDSTKLVIFVDSQQAKQAMEKNIIDSMLEDKGIQKSEVVYVTTDDSKTLAQYMNKIVLSNNIQMADFTKDGNIAKIFRGRAQTLDNEKNFQNKIIDRISRVNENASSVTFYEEESQEKLVGAKLIAALSPKKDEKVNLVVKEDNAKEVNKISDEVVRNLFGKDYDKGFALRKKDAEIIKGIIAEALEGISPKSLESNSITIKTTFTSIIREKMTEPTRLGSLLNLVPFYEGDRIQLKSDINREACIDALKRNVASYKEKQVSTAPVSPSSSINSKTRTTELQTGY